MKNILAVYLHSAAKFFILRSSFFVLHSSLLIRIFAQVIIFNIKGCKARNLSLPEHGFL